MLEAMIGMLKSSASPLPLAVWKVLVVEAPVGQVVLVAWPQVGSRTRNCRVSAEAEISTPQSSPPVPPMAR